MADAVSLAATLAAAGLTGTAAVVSLRASRHDWRELGSLAEGRLGATKAAALWASSALCFAVANAVAHL